MRPVVLGLAAAVASLIAPTIGVGVASAQSMRFSFGGGPTPQGSRRVEADDLYNPSRGYGFEPSSGQAGSASFSVAVPEGDYRVRLILAKDAPDGVVVRAEARRLMLERATGDDAFVVNVRTPALTPPPANAPGVSAVRLKVREAMSRTWDDRLTLEISGDPAAILSVAVEPVTVPRLILLGDSTVADQIGEPVTSWGQMLPRFLDEGVSVANHAESGETLKSFLVSSRLDKALSQIRLGDVVMIQFGHNDQKTQWPQTYVDAASTYPAYLHAYVAEIRRRGGTPVLVTSTQRRTFGPDGHIVNSHGDYPAAVVRAGHETGAPVIDLSALSTRFYEALGPEGSAAAFATPQDLTHHSAYGAYGLARAAAEALSRLDTPVAGHLLTDLPAFDIDAPPSPDQFDVAPSASRADVAPSGS